MRVMTWQAFDIAPLGTAAIDPAMVHYGQVGPLGLAAYRGALVPRADDDDANEPPEGPGEGERGRLEAPFLEGVDWSLGHRASNGASVNAADEEWARAAEASMMVTDHSTRRAFASPYVSITIDAPLPPAPVWRCWL
jgi:hypothetical protein